MAVNVYFQFENADEIIQAIIASGEEGALAAARALRAEAQEVLAHSQMEVPVDTGALKNSGRIDPIVGIKTTANSMEVDVVYGSTAADYAVYVHENLESHHPHGNAKFVEGPLLRQMNGISERIADKVMKAQKGALS